MKNNAKNNTWYKINSLLIILQDMYEDKQGDPEKEVSSTRFCPFDPTVIPATGYTDEVERARLSFIEKLSEGGEAAAMEEITLKSEYLISYSYHAD